MTTDSDRSPRIHDRLATQLKSMGLLVERLSLDEWNEIDLDASARPSNWTFGWIPLVDTGTNWAFRFCPELIATQTEYLEDQDFEDYLDGIEATVNLHIMFWEQVADKDERTRQVDDHLYESAPGTLRLLSDVQFRALDATVA